MTTRLKFTYSFNMKFNCSASFVIFWLYMISILSCYAQKPQPSDYGIQSKKALAYFLSAQEQAMMRDRQAAVELYAKAIEKEPNFAQAHYELGINAYLTRSYAQAVTHLEAAYNLDSAKYGGFYLGESYFYTMRYAEAIPQYEHYIQSQTSSNKYTAIAKQHLDNSYFAVEALKDSVEFEPRNLGAKVNSPGDDYLPYLTADDTYLLFTSRRPGSTGGFDQLLQDYPEDFYYTIYQDGKWQPAVNLGPPVNTERNEGSAAISPDGRILFFTICDHPQGMGRCDIFYTYRKGNQWSEPKNMGPNINTMAWESQPCLSHDGKTLYFVSDRDGGMGGRDLYVSTFENGEWSAAQNMGEPLNTSGNEGGPFLHADDQTLYFASDAHEGFGGMDLFVSYLSESGWTAPRNLGYPLNTVEHEANIFVNTQGDKGFINSTRAGGIGRSDIYEFVLAGDIRPQKATFLRGLVRDSVTQKPLTARIQLIDVEKGDTLRTQVNDPQEGTFLMSLPLERSYAAFVEAPGYLFTSKHFYLKNLKEEVYFDLIIDMVPIRKGANIVLNNIFFDTGEYTLKETSTPELERLKTYLTQNPNMRIELQGHTDDVGSENDNQVLSQRRADAVRQYLIEAGIEASRITAVGYGENQPVAPNDTDENRALNRRTEMKILEMGKP